MDTIAVGDVTITRVEECNFLNPNASPDRHFKGFRQSEWEQDCDSLAPTHWDRDSNRLRFFLQPFVVRSEGRTILIDAGAGDDKIRPNVPLLGGLQTEFLERLALAGFQPEDVDTVVCTHLHVDHVGWNTRLVDGTWVPTFPKARYLFPLADFDFFHPDNDGRLTRVGERINKGVFVDSVLPVAHDGLMDTFEAPFRIDKNISLVPMPGHTPGQSGVEVYSAGERALFSGDVLHSPVQIIRPDWNHHCCEDDVLARQTRRKVLDWCVDNRALLIPASFAGSHALWLKREGSHVQIDRWAEFLSATTEPLRF